MIQFAVADRLELAIIVPTVENRSAGPSVVADSLVAMPTASYYYDQDSAAVVDVECAAEERSACCFEAA